jgi:hypothetical protein
VVRSALAHCDASSARPDDAGGPGAPGYSGPGGVAVEAKNQASRPVNAPGARPTLVIIVCSVVSGQGPEAYPLRCVRLREIFAIQHRFTPRRKVVKRSSSSRTVLQSAQGANSARPCFTASVSRVELWRAAISPALSSSRVTSSISCDCAYSRSSHIPGHRRRRAETACSRGRTWRPTGPDSAGWVGCRHAANLRIR